jgi:hypothetical protein
MEVIEARSVHRSNDYWSGARLRLVSGENKEVEGTIIGVEPLITCVGTGEALRLLVDVEFYEGHGRAVLPYTISVDHHIGAEKVTRLNLNSRRR